MPCRRNKVGWRIGPQRLDTLHEVVSPLPQSLQRLPGGLGCVKPSSA